MSHQSSQELPTASPAAVRRWPDWLSAGLAVAAVGWGANQFAPLLITYRTDLGLSAAVASATFGLHALGLIPGLFVGGPLSDRRGRRIVMVIALPLSLVLAEEGIRTRVIRTIALMPVSSSNSRTHAAFGVSPASTPPPGNTE